MVFAIRIAMADDLLSILELWRHADVEPGHTDDFESLTKLITHG